MKSKYINVLHVRLFVSFLSLLLLVKAPAYALNERIVAIVNDAIVSQYDLDNTMRLLALSPSSRSLTQKELKQQALKLLIDNTLKTQELLKHNEIIDNETLQKRLNDIAKESNTTLQGLEKKVTAKKIDWDFFTKNIQTELEWQNYIIENFLPQVTITDAQVNTLYNAQNQGNITLQKHVVDIFLPYNNKMQQKEAQAKASHIMQALHHGESFQDLARKYSQSPSKHGDLGLINPHDLIPPLDNALSTLEKGQVSSIVTTPTGLHILKVIDVKKIIRPETIYTFVQTAYPTPSPINQDQGNAIVEHMMMLRKRIKSCVISPSLQKEFKDLQFNLVSNIPENKLPAPLLSILKTLKNKQTTRPIQSPDSFLMFTLCQKQLSSPQLTTKDMIRSTLTQNQLETFAQQYLETLRSTSYIEYK